MKGCMSRRRFLASTAVVTGGLYGVSLLGSGKKHRKIRQRRADNQLEKGLAVVHGEDPKAMTYKAIEELGGMGKLVCKGDVVVVKPNMTWADRGPEYATNTNPQVVAAVVEMCLAAGAAKVKVFDHTISSNPRPAYEGSGIQVAAEKAGADVVYVNPDRFYMIQIPDGARLKEWAFYEDCIYKDKCDVLINVPATKQHGTSRLSMGLKNAFGMVGLERGNLHQGIHQNIADLHRVVRVDLTVLDAFRILLRNGPYGGRLQDVSNSPKNARRVVASVDPVAVDAYGSTLYGFQPSDIGFINEAHKGGLGEIDFKKNGFEEFTI
ncbi:MAG: DUF362 domain-containing protein [Planctomycetes bacterium]|nr:DUF362 domain-containing protein [Planctomycetota bacterium]